MAPGSQDTFSEQKMCTNCHKTDSSETWRVVKNLTYCNACGIYLRDHNIQRPQRLVEQSAARRATKRALQPVSCPTCSVSLTAHAAARPPDALARPGSAQEVQPLDRPPQRAGQGCLAECLTACRSPLAWPPYKAHKAAATRSGARSLPWLLPLCAPCRTTAPCRALPCRATPPTKTCWTRSHLCQVPACSSCPHATLGLHAGTTYALQACCLHYTSSPCTAAQTPMPSPAADFTEELRRSKRSRTRSPILDDILEDEVIEEPSRRARTPNLDDEDRAPGPRTDGSQSGMSTSACTTHEPACPTAGLGLARPHLPASP